MGLNTDTGVCGDWAWVNWEIGDGRDDKLIANEIAIAIAIAIDRFCPFQRATSQSLTLKFQSFRHLLRPLIVKFYH